MNNGETGGSTYRISCFTGRLNIESKFYYAACPDCKKKVMDARCEHCGKNFTSPNLTYMFSSVVNDLSGSMFVSFSKEQGDQIIGMSAQNLDEFKQNTNAEEINDYMNSRCFKPYSIIVKPKMDSY